MSCSECATTRSSRHMLPACGIRPATAVMARAARRRDWRRGPWAGRAGRSCRSASDLKQRQRASRGIAEPQLLERGVFERRFLIVGRRAGQRGERMRGRLAREHERDGGRTGDETLGVQGFWRRQVESDEQHVAAIYQHLRTRFQQPGAERAIVRADGRRSRACARGDAPVARGRVVHGVVEIGRRNEARCRAERETDAMNDRDVGVRRSEHGRETRRGHGGGSRRVFGGLKRQPDRRRRAPALIDRQCRWRVRRQRRVDVRPFAAQRRAAFAATKAIPARRAPPIR